MTKEQEQMTDEELAKSMVGKCFEFITTAPTRCIVLIASSTRRGWVSIVNCDENEHYGIEIDEDHILEYTDSDHWKEVPRSEFDAHVAKAKAKIDEMLKVKK